MVETTELLANRYGGAARRRKPWVIVATSLLAAIFFGFAIYASFVGKPLASAELTSYNQVDEGHMVGNFTALTGAQAASCVFKAYNGAGAIVGYAEVDIPANNPDTKALSVTVKTVLAASVLKVEGCNVK